MSIQQKVVLLSIILITVIISRNHQCLIFAAAKYDKNNNIIIDDFNDKNFTDNCTGIWKNINDSDNQGNSICEMKLVKGVLNKGYAIRLDYTLGKKFQYRYANLDNSLKVPLDLSKYSSLSFRLRGSNHKLKVKIWSENVKGWDWHGFSISSTPSEWKKFTIPFFMFKQEGWGKSQKLDLRLIKKIEFQTSSMRVNEKGWFEIDDIKAAKVTSKKFLFKEFPIVKKDKKGNGCFLGVFGVDYINNLSLVHSLEKKIGKKFSHIMWYEDWKKEFPLKTVRKLWNAGYSSHITWEAWLSDDKDAVKLDDILNGNWDFYINKWAKAAKKFGHPLFIRWGHEFNGDWYPWSIPKNNFDSKKYVKVFQYLHNKFDELGAVNVLWIWCPMNQSWPNIEKNNIVDAYPGDQYVDWIALDGYNFGITPGWSDKWMSFHDVYKNIYTLIVEKFPGKPIMIGEFGTSPNGGDKSKWIKDAFNQIRNVFKGIKCAVWFNIDKETDWRIDENSETALAFKKAVESDYFLTSRDNLFNIKKITKKERKVNLSLLTKYNPYRKKRVLKIGYKPSNLKIDGDLQEWKKNFSINFDREKKHLIKEKPYSNKDDFSAEIGLLWDEDNLYIGAKVIDDIPFNNQYINGEIWRGDCIELVISLDPKADLMRTYFKETDFQILITPGNQNDIPAHIWNVHLKKRINGIIIADAVKNGYNIELKIPFDELCGFKPHTGVRIGFNIAVDDADETDQRDIQSVWFGDSTFYCNPSVWNLIEFVK